MLLPSAAAVAPANAANTSVARGDNDVQQSAAMQGFDLLMAMLLGPSCNGTPCPGTEGSDDLAAGEYLWQSAHEMQARQKYSGLGAVVPDQGDDSGLSGGGRLGPIVAPATTPAPPVEGLILDAVMPWRPGRLIDHAQPERSIEPAAQAVPDAGARAAHEVVAENPAALPSGPSSGLAVVVAAPEQPQDRGGTPTPPRADDSLTRNQAIARIEPLRGADPGPLIDAARQESASESGSGYATSMGADVEISPGLEKPSTSSIAPVDRQPTAGPDAGAPLVSAAGSHAPGPQTNPIKIDTPMPGTGAPVHAHASHSAFPAGSSAFSVTGRTVPVQGALHVSAPGNPDTAAVLSGVVQKTSVGPLRSGEIQELTLQLEPEHLGKVEVRITVRGDRLEVVMQADSAIASQVLRENIHDLTRALAGKIEGRWTQVDVRLVESSRPDHDGDESDREQRERSQQNDREGDTSERRHGKHKD